MKPGMTAASDDEKAISDIITEFVATWNRRDAAAWAAQFAADSDHINVVGMLFEGREENHRRHAENFAGMFNDSTLRHHIRRLRFLSPDIALVDLDSEMRIVGPLPPAFTAISRRDADGAAVMRSRMRHVMTRADGRWQIVASQNSPMMTPPQG
jgi:uncharacterized protein (TIGR02246 family)